MPYEHTAASPSRACAYRRARCSQYADGGSAAIVSKSCLPNLSSPVGLMRSGDSQRWLVLIVVVKEPAAASLEAQPVQIADGDGHDLSERVEEIERYHWQHVPALLGRHHQPQHQHHQRKILDVYPCEEHRIGD